MEFSLTLTSTLSRSEINFGLDSVNFEDRTITVKDTTEDSVLNVDNTGIVEATVENILIDDLLTIVDSVTDEDNIDESVMVETIVIDNSVTIFETVNVEDNIDNSAKNFDTVTVEDNIYDSEQLLTVLWLMTL